MTRPPSPVPAYVQDSDFTLWNGDALEVLRTLPDESVHMCVTSPPFYGLRDYGTGTWEGGEEPEPTTCPACQADGGACDMCGGSGSLVVPCNHETVPARHGRGGSGSPGKNTEGAFPSEYPASTCGKCGATRIDRQIGLEETPEQWVQKLVEVFREVRRVLRRDGTLWLEVGDSYAASMTSDRRMFQPTGPDGRPAVTRESVATKQRTAVSGLKQKDLIGAPWLLAFALRADGWYLRSDIVWSRPNPMPESVTDRPTKSHSYVFLLSRSARYFFDQEAVREPNDAVHMRWVGGRRDTHHNKNAGQPLVNPAAKAPHPDGFAAIGRNIRSVWNIATQPFSGRELGGGSGRTTSPDCPVHGVRRPPASVALDDEQPAASQTHRTESSESHPALEPAAVPASTSPDPGAVLEDSPSAIPRSSASSRTGAESEQRDTDDAQQALHIESTPPSPDPVATTGRRHESSSEADSDEGETGSDPSAETPSRSAHTSKLTGGAYSPPGQAPHGNARGSDPKACTCKYIDHFAAYPEELVRRCILAGSSERGCCPECGAPWVREVKVERVVRSTGGPSPAHTEVKGYSDSSAMVTNALPQTKTLGWHPSCECFDPIDGFRPARLDPIPCTVLDPFSGSGTTALVARKHGRRTIGIELSADYCALTARRLQQLSLLAEA